MADSDHAGQAERRAYWTSQLEAAHAFMHRTLDYPVAECGEPLSNLRTAAQDAGVRIEFAGAKHVRGLDRIFRLRSGLIDGFLAAGAEMNRRGWVMRVEDGFRTREMQKFLALEASVFDAILSSVIWELDGRMPSPEFLLRRSMALVALMPKVGTHMSGSAIDISVRQLADGREVDRGASYLEMSELTPMHSPFVTPASRENRQAITAIMRRHGFIDYPFEFWHYNGGDAYEAIILKTGKPARYGAIDWSASDDSVRPMDDPCQPLNDSGEIRIEIERALQRMLR